MRQRLAIGLPKNRTPGARPGVRSQTVIRRSADAHGQKLRWKRTKPCQTSLSEAAYEPAGRLPAAARLQSPTNFWSHFEYRISTPISRLATGDQIVRAPT